MLNQPASRYYLVFAPSRKARSKVDSFRKSPSQNIGWKMAPTYVGQQPPDAPGRHNANAAQGTLDAGHAATLAIAAGFPEGTIIYLDIEPSKKKLQNAMLDYYTNWVGGISTFGFRP